jgi:hypothetical protein
MQRLVTFYTVLPLQLVVNGTEVRQWVESPGHGTFPSFLKRRHRV